MGQSVLRVDLTLQLILTGIALTDTSKTVAHKYHGDLCVVVVFIYVHVGMPIYVGMLARV